MTNHEHHPRHVHLDEVDWRESVAQTELEGELLIGFVTGTVERVAELRGADAPPVRRVLDIGSGPGVGTCELARLLPEAHVVAVDGSPEMLSRARQRADQHGLGARVSTHLAELPDGLDGLEPVDMIWASMSLHHIGDEIALLRALHNFLLPSGVIAIAELAEPMRVLPDELDVGTPGLSGRIERAEATWFAAMREGLTNAAPSTDPSSMLASAGFDVVGSWVVRQRFDAPLSDLASQVVLGHLRRIRKHLDELLDQSDLDAIDVLGNADDPRGAVRRPDVFVAASREIFIARPAS